MTMDVRLCLHDFKESLFVDQSPTLLKVQEVGNI